MGDMVGADLSLAGCYLRLYRHSDFVAFFPGEGWVHGIGERTRYGCEHHAFDSDLLESFAEISDV